MLPCKSTAEGVSLKCSHRRNSSTVSKLEDVSIFESKGFNHKEGN